MTLERGQGICCRDVRCLNPGWGSSLQTAWTTALPGLQPGYLRKRWACASGRSCPWGRRSSVARSAAALVLGTGSLSRRCCSGGSVRQWISILPRLDQF